jgi:translation initiation factor IF-3
LRRRRNNNEAPDRSNEPRVNDRIRVPRVLVIDEEGNRLGEFLTPDALSLARDRGLDLVEVAPNGHPPVCKILDFGRMKYDKKKKDNAARRNQQIVTTKEVKIRPKTDQHDMDVRIRAARRFLQNGDKVKVTVRFRGREHRHYDIGEVQCMRLFEAVEEFATIELRPRMDGRQMVMLLTPIPAASRKPASETEEAVATAGAAPTPAAAAEKSS